jgi:HEAT repeat protein
MLALCGREPESRIALALESLADTHADVRVAAHRILDRAPIDQVEPGILAALEADEDLPAATRVKMAFLLRRADSREALGALLDLLEDDDESLRHAAARSIGEIARRRDDLRPVAWDHLELLVEEDGSTKVQNAALAALAELDGERALPSVRTRVGHEDPEVRKTARSLLRQIRKEVAS